jgi:Tol biopolymer transport system component
VDERSTRQRFERLGDALPVPPPNFTGVAQRALRRQRRRTLESIVLIITVLAATAGAMYGLSRAFLRVSVSPASSSRSEGRILFFRYPLSGSNRIQVVPSPQPPQVLYAMNPDGSGVTRFAEFPANATWMTWSPDGRWLALTSTSESGGTEVDIMRGDGTGRHALTDMGHPAELAWAPDERTIAFASGLAPMGIEVIATTGGAARRLTDPPPGCEDGVPAWSPDGRAIAFVRNCGGNRFRELYVMDPDGGNEVQVTHLSGYPVGLPEYPRACPCVSGWPSWSPDGREIAFALERKGAVDIVVIQPDGKDLRSLLVGITGVFYYATPIWSPDGRSIVFESGLHSTDINVMHADGTGVRKLVTVSEDEQLDLVAWLPLPSIRVQRGAAHPWPWVIGVVLVLMLDGSLAYRRWSRRRTSADRRA